MKGREGKKKGTKKESEIGKNEGKRKKGWGGCQYERKETKRYFCICTLMIRTKSNFGGTNINSHSLCFLIQIHSL